MHRKKINITKNYQRHWTNTNKKTKSINITNKTYRGGIRM